MKWRLTPILIAVPIVALSSLACSRVLSVFLTGDLAPWPGEPNSSAGCDAIDLLVAKAVITNDGLLQDGTRECDYKLTITNTGDQASIRPYMYRWEEDGYANTRKGEWQSYETLGPGESSEWFGRHVTFTDPDANGPYVFEYQRMAGVVEHPECQAVIAQAGELSDNGILRELSIPLPDNPCAPVK